MAFPCGTTAAIAAAVNDPASTGRKPRLWQRPLPTLLQRPRLPHRPPPPTPPSPTPYAAHPVKPVGRCTERRNDSDRYKGSEEETQSVSTVADVLRLMDALRLPVDADMYASLLKECTERRDVAQGAEVHAHVRRSNGRLLQGARGTSLANRLLLMYTACGWLESALEMFDGMPTRDPISWATVITGLSDAGFHRQVLQLFAEMLHEQELGRGGAAAVLSIRTALRSCAGARDLVSGRTIHGLSLKLGYRGAAGSSSGMTGCVARLYGNLGQENDARKVFASMSDPRDSAVWEAMCSTYSQLRMANEALELFQKMRKTGRRLRGSLFACMLRACGSSGEELPGRQLHACVIKHGVDADRAVQSSLVEMYGRCGLALEASRVLEVTVGQDHEKAAAFRTMVLGLLVDDKNSMDAIKCL